MKAKFVNEIMHFERSNDPLVTLQVGKRAQIIKWLNTYGVINYVINNDLTINVNGNVDLSDKNLTIFPYFIKFNYVSGYFDCSNNHLTSLVGCPSSVGNDFYCYNNQLTSLVGCPSSVGGDFYCYNNQLTSLVGCPSSVGDDFYCYNNKTKFTKEDVKKLCKVKYMIYV